MQNRLGHHNFFYAVTTGTDLNHKYLLQNIFILPDLVVFDNSYSWTRAKTVLYNVDIIEQDADDNSLVEDIDHMTKGGSWDAVAEKNETTHL